MLVLSRKQGQAIKIAQNIIVTVNRIAGSRVTIGISAPREIEVNRGEHDKREKRK